MVGGFKGGEHVYINFIPQGVKEIIAHGIEVVAVLFVLYFVIRFILGFFIDKKEKESDELKATNNLGTKIDELGSNIDKLAKEIKQGRNERNK